jgi:DNA-binding GntR family transcriptional regulator
LRPPASASAPAGRRAARRPALPPLAPKTLVEQVAEAIVRAAAEGQFLPGDRVVEAEIARHLGVSRVPVREALRLLQSQGIVVNTPYRGMRLMEVSGSRLRDILKVRLQLEQLAVREVLGRSREDPEILAPVRTIVAEMRRAGQDIYRIATLDTAFHRTLCELAGNETLVRVWEPLSSQLTIIVGLSALQKDPASIVVEHEELLAALERGDAAELLPLMETHILDYPTRLDYEGYVASRRG